MQVGNLYVVNVPSGFNDSSDVFILTHLRNKPPEKGVNRDWLPIGLFRNLATGEQLKINHPEHVFVPIDRLDSSNTSETQKNNL
jgi:hypothetical protein